MEEQVQQPSQLQPTVQNTPPVDHQSSKSKWIVIVLILIALVSLGGFGGKYYLDQQKLKAITTFEECQKAGFPVMESYPSQCRTPDGRTFVQKLSEEEKKILIPPTDPTANWKTYTNTEYNYSFKYPDNYVLQQYSNGTYIPIASNAGLVRLSPLKNTNPLKGEYSEAILISVKDNSKNLSIEEFNKQSQLPRGINLDKIEINYKVITVDGIEGLSTNDFWKIPEAESCSSEKDQEIFIRYTKEIYTISFLKFTRCKPQEKISYEIFDQILSTFKFLDQQVVLPKEVSDFPVYPGAKFIRKEYFDPCSTVNGDRCNTTEFVWQTTDSGKSVIEWYRDSIANTGWLCLYGGSGAFDEDYKSVNISSTCKKGNKIYGFFITSEGKNTHVILSFSGKQ